MTNGHRSQSSWRRLGESARPSRKRESDLLFPTSYLSLNINARQVFPSGYER